MNHKEKTIDQLLGALTPEEKAGQLLVYGLSGTFVDADTLHFVDKCNISGIRTSPFFRKFIRYLPPGSPGIQNVVRPPALQEKLWDEDIHAQHLRASEYADLLNKLRRRAMDRKHGIPIHYVLDYEGGSGGNYVPPGMVVPPAPMGLGHVGDLDLVTSVWRAVGTQLKSIGFDWVHGPVVDVNTNPENPEINTRSFDPDPETVTNCARAQLKGLAEARLIGTLKHYPGRGAAGEDAHFGVSSVELDRAGMDRDHLSPYANLSAEGVVPAVMLAHSIYPALDDTLEIATVSKPIITGILREELGFGGVVTTDSMTMGGLMAKYSCAEAAIRAFDAGVDIVLLKDENNLRYEVYDAVVEAIKSGRLSEDHVAGSLRRIWSLKWDYGLFENGGLVETEGLDKALFNPEFRKVGEEAARRAMHLLRDRQKVLPLKPEQKVLIVDRVISTHLWQNDSWNYPAMFWNFMLEHSPNVGYTDYKEKTLDRATAVIDHIAPQVDVIVATAVFSRGQKPEVKKFLSNLKRFGKPVILVSSNPYELIVPKDIDTVVVNYSLMHEGMEATAQYLYGKGRE